MNKPIYMILAVLALASAALAGCASKAAEPTDVPVPSEYAGMTNPFNGQADAAAAGKTIYTENCASCHGDSGKGDGPAGEALDPKPADLTEVAANDPDDRINWIIHEGGAPAGFSASMTAWKDVLSDDEIWQVITYMRTLK